MPLEADGANSTSVLVPKPCDTWHVCLGWGHPGRWWPTASQLEAETPSEWEDRTRFFMEVYTIAIVATMAAVDLMRLAVVYSARWQQAHRQDYAGLERLERSSNCAPLARDVSRQVVVNRVPSLASARTSPNLDPSPVASEVAEVEAVQVASTGYTVGDVAFAAYHATYNIFCWGLVGYALEWGYVSEDTGSDFAGLDFELLSTWLTWVLLSHLLCAVYACATQPAEQLTSPFAGKVPISVTPLLSEMVDSLRDPITAGIYLANRAAPSYLCTALVFIGVLLPNWFIYREPEALRAVRTAYWPIAFIGAEDSNGDQSLFMLALRKADDLTRPHRQYTALLEDVPQTAAAALYTASRGTAPLVIIFSATISVLKILFVLLGRPYILCFMAAVEEPWRVVSEADVRRAVACTQACSWQARCRAARELLSAPGVSTSVRSAAAIALGHLFADEVDVMYATQDSEDPDESLDGEKRKTRNSLARLLADAGCAKAVSTALLCLGESEEDIAELRVAAVQTKTLDDPDVKTRLLAVKRLAELPACGDVTAQAVARLLCDEVAEVRQAAVETLVLLREAGADFAANVASLLQDEDSKIKVAAIDALGGFKSASASFAPEIARLLADPDWSIREAAVAALGKLSGSGSTSLALPELQRLICCEDWRFKQSACRAVGAMGEAGAPLAAHIARLLSDEDGDVRAAAAEAFVRLGAAAVSAAPILEAHLLHEDWRVRHEAARAYNALGKAAFPFLEHLIPLMEDDVEDVRQVAVAAIAHISECRTSCNLLEL